VGDGSADAGEDVVACSVETSKVSPVAAASAGRGVVVETGGGTGAFEYPP
jgi:hypothetical protein